MSRFTFDTDVRADLDAIWDYIAVENQSPVAASNQIEVLYDKFSLLATQPFLGEAREDLGKNVRMFVVRPYVILYRPKDHGIKVAQVVHSAQDIYAVFRHKG
ncbi:MAG: type II toxin-antitoxin system RelE/ParE family toxin [Candidatus Nealsonbacteria bacterium]|nr:type II toxin-antitoxin system RelE/ParE family toxin [Candidatus Nealsonbacteria bacterium]